MAPTCTKLRTQLVLWHAFLRSNRLEVPAAERAAVPSPLAVFVEGNTLGEGTQGAVRLGTYWPKGRAGTGFPSAIKRSIVATEDLTANPLLHFTESMVVAAQGSSKYIAPMQACDVRPQTVSARLGEYSRNADGRETFVVGEEQHGLAWGEVRDQCSLRKVAEGHAGVVLGKQVWQVTAITHFAVLHLMEPYTCAPLLPRRPHAASNGEFAAV